MGKRVFLLSFPFLFPGNYVSETVFRFLLRERWGETKEKQALEWDSPKEEQEISTLV